MPCQLRRTGKPATIIGVKDILRLNKDVTRFGRHSQNDHFLDSAEYMCLISRWHTEIHCVNQDGQQRYILRDNGLNGTYVNDVRVDGNVALEKGDIVTFGHPNGKNIKPGEKAVQQESEFSFEFEAAAEEGSSEGSTPTRAAPVAGVGRAAVMCSPVIPPIVRAHTMGRSGSPSISSVSSQQANRNINNNVSRKLIADTAVSSTFVLKDISNTGTKSPGLVHLDQLFATHTTSPSSRPPSRQDSGITSVVTNAGDAAYSAAASVAAVQQFADDTEDNGSDDDIFTNHDSLQTQPANLQHSTSINSTVSQLQMHLQMPITSQPSSTPTSSYPALSDIFERPSQLTTSHGVAALMSNRPRSRGKKTLSESGSTGTKKGRGRGRGRVNNKQSALNEEDNLMQGGKGKKRKKNTANWSSAKKKRSLDDDDESDSESEYVWHYEGDKCDSYDCSKPSANKVSWVQCDDCDAWYHTVCAGTNYDLVKLSNAEFHCGCS